MRGSGLSIQMSLYFSSRRKLATLFKRIAMPNLFFPRKAATASFAAACIALAATAAAQKSPGPEPAPMPAPVAPQHLTRNAFAGRRCQRCLPPCDEGASTIPVKGREVTVLIRNGFPGRTHRQIRSKGLPA